MSLRKTSGSFRGNVKKRVLSHSCTDRELIVEESLLGTKLQVYKLSTELNHTEKD